MKKQLIITFDILQDKLEKQKPNLVIYSESSPEDKNKFSVKELNASGLKKMIKPILEIRQIDGKFGKIYCARITEEQLRELFDF